MDYETDRYIIAKKQCQIFFPHQPYVDNLALVASRDADWSARRLYKEEFLIRKDNEDYFLICKQSSVSSRFDLLV